ncbi:tRNA A64-2'-O-ribosylphosphate transferase [Massospora cicadina]|nr:tRNA A64-2'-O-ribosylphosphate transferase [Massospora cicadina]
MGSSSDPSNDNVAVPIISRRSLRNRLLSILYDAEFLTELVEALFTRFPCLANQRCGGWYVPYKPITPSKPQLRWPARFAWSWFANGTGTVQESSGTAAEPPYASDPQPWWRVGGHRVLGLVLGGYTLTPVYRVVVIDSTQRGKTVPDAYSRTIPIYCATLNRAIKAFLGLEGGLLVSHPARASEWDTELHTPPKLVGPSERRVIGARIPTFVRKLLDSGVDMRRVCELVVKPLRPVWVTPQSKLHRGFSDWPRLQHGSPSQRGVSEFERPPCGGGFLDGVGFLPIVCVAVSDPTKDAGAGRSLSFTYVQGAGDDEEGWSKGLTCVQFWDNLDRILGSLDSEEALESLIRSLVEGASQLSVSDFAPANSYDFMGASRLAVGGWRAGRPPASFEGFDVVINCTDACHAGFAGMELPPGKFYLELGIPEGKRGPKRLAAALPSLVAWFEKGAEGFGRLVDGPRILCHCAQGVDRSVGVALALLVRFMDDSGALDFTQPWPPKVDKLTIQRRLIFMMQYRSKIKPSRATLKAVNAFFMPPDDQPYKFGPTLLILC